MLNIVVCPISVARNINLNRERDYRDTKIY